MTSKDVDDIKELHAQHIMHGIELVTHPSALTFGRSPHWRHDYLFHPLSGTMGYTTRAHGWGWMAELLDVVLRGYGQVTFINNPVAGALILAASFVNSTYYGVFGLLGIIVSTLTAYAFSFPRGGSERHG